MPIVNIPALTTTKFTRGRAQPHARQTPQSKLKDTTKKILLGVVVDQSELAAVMRPGASAAPNFASAVEGDHITSVKV